jgi:hypothetical protein
MTNTYIRLPPKSNILFSGPTTHLLKKNSQESFLARQISGDQGIGGGY